MRNMGGPAADATSECTPAPPYVLASFPGGHSNSRNEEMRLNEKWEMRKSGGNGHSRHSANYWCFVTAVIFIACDEIKLKQHCKLPLCIGYVLHFWPSLLAVSRSLLNLWTAHTLFQLLQGVILRLLQFLALLWIYVYLSCTYSTSTGGNVQQLYTYVRQFYIPT